MSSNLSTISVDQFQNNGSEILKNMRALEEFCDVTLISEDEVRVRAHKVVLASASTLFRDMFQSDDEEYQVILMKGVSLELMTAMLEIIYNGETKVNEEECEDFLNVLKDYRVLEEKVNQNRHLKPKYGIVCNFWNRGFCKEGSLCSYGHPEQGCKEYINHGECLDTRCKRRHRSVCKFWSDGWCKRENLCQFLHVTHRNKLNQTRNNRSSSKNSKIDLENRSRRERSLNRN